MKKKILIISPYFYPHIEWGGPVSVAWNLAQFLNKEGYKVEVLTTDVSAESGKIKNFHNEPGAIKITYAKSFLPSLAWKFRVFLSIDQIIKGAKLIPGFDLVHFNDIYILQNFILALYCRKHKIPYIVTPHGNLSFARERSKGYPKKIFYFLFGKNFLENSSKIISVSGAEKKYIDKTFPNLSSKTVYVPQIVSVEKFKKIDIKSEYNIPKDDNVVLFIGRIYPLKGVKELLLGFINYLKEVSTSVTLILAGPDAGGLGEIKQILNESGKLKNKVVLAGEVAGDLKYSLFSQCDILCLLSKTESMPMTILEAAYFGKPVICSKECNVQDMVNYGGAVLSTRGAHDITQKLEALLGSREFLKKTGQKSQEWFNKDLDQTKVLGEYNKIYDNL